MSLYTKPEPVILLENGVRYMREFYPEATRFDYAWAHHPTGKRGTSRVWVLGSPEGIYRLLCHWNRGGGDWSHWWPI